MVSETVTTLGVPAAPNSKLVELTTLGVNRLVLVVILPDTDAVPLALKLISVTIAPYALMPPNTLRFEFVSTTKFGVVVVPKFKLVELATLGVSKLLAVLILPAALIAPPVNNAPTVTLPPTLALPPPSKMPEAIKLLPVTLPTALTLPVVAKLRP